MPKFLEEKLKQQARRKGYKGDRADHYVFGTMNAIGAMHGSKETAKGRKMEEKHDKETAMKKTAISKPEGPMREMRIEIHRGPKKEVTGHTVHHHMMPKPSKKTHSFYEDDRHSQPFGPGQHAEMMKHIADVLGAAHNMAGGMAESEAAEGEGGEE